MRAKYTFGCVLVTSFVVLAGVVFLGSRHIQLSRAIDRIAKKSIADITSDVEGVSATGAQVDLASGGFAFTLHSSQVSIRELDEELEVQGEGWVGRISYSRVEPDAQPLKKTFEIHMTRTPRHSLLSTPAELADALDACELKDAVVAKTTEEIAYRESRGFAVLLMLEPGIATVNWRSAGREGIAIFLAAEKEASLMEEVRRNAICCWQSIGISNDDSFTDN